MLQVYAPKPDPRRAVLYGEHGAFVPLDSHSPRWLRNRLTGMATMFRRELPADSILKVLEWAHPDKKRADRLQATNEPEVAYQETPTVRALVRQE